MASNESETTSSKKRGLGCCLIKLTFLFLLVIGGVGAGGWFFKASNQKSLLDQIEAGRVNGMPLDMVSYNQRYQSAANNENGLITTGDWMAALEPLGTQEYEETGSKIGLIGHGPEPTLVPGRWRGKEDAEKFLANYHDTVVGLQLASTGTAFFEIDLTENKSLDEKTISELYRGLELLKLNCFVHLHNSNRDAVATCLVSILRYSSCLENQPGNQAQRFLLDQDAFGFVGRFVHRIEFKADQLSHLSAAAERDYWPGLVNALHRERAERIWMYTDIDGFSASKLSSVISSDPAWKEFWENKDLNFFYSPFVADDAKRYLEYCDRVESEMTGEYLAAKDRIHDFEHRMQDLELTGLDSIRYPTARFLAPRISPLIDGAIAAEANRRLLVTLIALDEYRLANKESVNQLSELVPGYLKEIPMDAYGVEPILFRVLPREVQVYSIGSNKNDDSAKRDDIVFRLLEEKWNPSGDPTIRVD